MNETHIRNLITEAVRALYSKPKLKPGVLIDRQPRSLAIEVDVSPWNPGLLIGEGGATKFALELLIAYAYDLDEDRGVNIHVASKDKRRIDRTPDGQDADAERIKPIAEAAAELLGGSVELETGRKTIMALFSLPERVAHDVKPPLSKIIRSAGKAGGFKALPYVE